MKTNLSLIIMGLFIAIILINPVVSAGDTGNKAQSGSHYNLNIIGQKNVKNMPDYVAGEVKSNGHVIFCPLNNKDDGAACRIYLAEAAEDSTVKDIQVLDPDGTDNVARLMIPNPYPCGGDLENEYAPDAAYRIYVRVLGAPGGFGKMITGLCETREGGTVEAGDVCEGDTWMSATELSLASHNPSNKDDPRQKFVDVTHELTTVDLSSYWICGDGNDQCNHVGLFDDNPFDLSEETTDFLYFWDVWNTDMKIIQLRFYPVEQECPSG